MIAIVKEAHHVGVSSPFFVAVTAPGDIETIDSSMKAGTGLRMTRVDRRCACVGDGSGVTEGERGGGVDGD